MPNGGKIRLRLTASQTTTRLSQVKLLDKQFATHKCRLGMFALFSATIVACVPLRLTSQTEDRTKIADGDYLTHTSSPRNKDEKLRESWVLWRTGSGQYVVESDLQIERDATITKVFHQTIFLSHDLRPEEIKMLSLTSPEKNEVDVQLKPEEVRVKDRNGESTLAVPPGYDIHEPITPWSLSSFARRVRPTKGTGMAVVFVTMDESGPQAPIALKMLFGRVQCLGSEEIEAGGRKFTARKYMVHLGPFPGESVWLSEEGLVLASQNEENPEQRTEIV